MSVSLYVFVLIALAARTEHDVNAVFVSGFESMNADQLFGSSLWFSVWAYLFREFGRTTT